MIFTLEDPIAFWEEESQANHRQSEFKTASICDEIDDVSAKALKNKLKAYYRVKLFKKTVDVGLKQ